MTLSTGTHNHAVLPKCVKDASTIMNIVMESKRKQYNRHDGHDHYKQEHKR